MKIFISGPSVSTTIEVLDDYTRGSMLDTVENIIEKFCRLTGDLEKDYTATFIE